MIGEYLWPNPSMYVKSTVMRVKYSYRYLVLAEYNSV
jgi:hypothetical protein